MSNHDGGVIRYSGRPGDFKVVCDDCGWTGSYLRWENVVYCRVSGEGGHVCPDCGGDRPTAVPFGNG